MMATWTDRIFEDIVETIREPLLVLDSDLKVILVNKSFINTFKVTREETLSNLIYDLGNRQWDIPKLRELLGTILPQKSSFDNYEVEHDFATIGRRTMLLNARQIEQVMGNERIILLTIEDITERSRLEDLLAESAPFFKSIGSRHLSQNTDSLEIYQLNSQLRPFHPIKCFFSSISPGRQSSFVLPTPPSTSQLMLRSRTVSE
ncbi:MAG: PAS domain-containing protein [Deltaproteobacteria bacterium]|nr:PAS domain-containing protein [Deltaproteobacteria bacterium]